MKILFCTGQGIGNVIQCIPALKTIKEVLGYEIDFWHMYGSYELPKLIPYVDGWFSGPEILNANVNDYDGKVCTGWIQHNTKELRRFAHHINKIETIAETIKPVLMTRSEVDVYMDAARSLGVKEEELLWHGNCNYEKMINSFDIVIHNGYNRFGASRWEIKSYPYYEKVAGYLEGLKVCSVGAPEEYIKGTENMTGLPLLKTLGLVKSTRLFLGNDSGIYHAANALETDNIVIFTATSIKKNYDERFHKLSTIITRDDLDCRPCQPQMRWLSDCKCWSCQDINPETVLHGIKQVITARFMSDASEIYDKDE